MIPSRLTTPIAYGRTAEIYAWEDDQVLKLFRAGWGEAEAHLEAEKVKAVQATGLPVAALHGVVEVNGRAGLLYERVSGVPLTEAFRQRPWTLFAAARTLAELHIRIHAHEVPQLPSLRQRLQKRIKSVDGMPEDVREAVLAMLAALPDDDSLCHGDFHPDNVLITAGGPVIIDWVDAACGSPLADVARTSLLLTVSTLPPTMPGKRLVNAARHLFHRSYLQRYVQHYRKRINELKAWRPIVAAARLAEDIPEERPQLEAIIRRGLRNIP